MKLIAITLPDFFDGEADLIQALFEAGLQRLHIRKPESDEAAFRALLNAIPKAFCSRISIHQHHSIAKEYGIKSLHFGESQRKRLKLQDFAWLRDLRYTLSTSVHEVKDLKNLQTIFDYAFFSPVFDSISKPGYKGRTAAGFSLQESDKVLEVIGLGGIHAENILQLKEMNFDGAAVLGSLWTEPEKAVETFQILKAKLQSL
ncbi:thiamine phosphate synthase [Pedobacter sp. SYSU D00535]|uniref:thiamine phosphate synthase n=1 Tax=Pedobacter sp. SYSU D00535 TaxID=2810308 RepID=UPI001A978A82|nr:thiamine phosphate synthase [Pedobacter sp. SYSU D00535]